MKKVIKILGVGSARDRELLEAVQMAASELDMALDIRMVSDIDAFIRLGISGIPSMVIEDRIVANGRIPGVSELKQLLSDEGQPEPAI